MNKEKQGFGINSFSVIKVLITSIPKGDEEVNGWRVPRSLCHIQSFRFWKRQQGIITSSFPNISMIYLHGYYNRNSSVLQVFLPSFYKNFSELALTESKIYYIIVMRIGWKSAVWQWCVNRYRNINRNRGDYYERNDRAFQFKQSNETGKRSYAIDARRTGRIDWLGCGYHVKKHRQLYRAMLWIVM